MKGDEQLLHLGFVALLCVLFFSIFIVVVVVVVFFFSSHCILLYLAVVLPVILPVDTRSTPVRNSGSDPYLLLPHAPPSIQTSFMVGEPKSI